MNTLTVNNQSSITPVIHVDETMLDSFIRFLDAKPKTVETYGRALKQFMKYLRLNGITNPTRDDVIGFREAMDVDHKPTTVQNYLMAVKQLFKWTEQEGLYPNIAKNVKGKELSREHKKNYLTGDQVKVILNSIDTETVQGRRDYAMLTLMVTCGLRDVEVVRANIGDLDSVGAHTVLFLQGKGRDEKAEYVKIPPKVEQAIRESLKDREGKSDTDPIFTSLSNNSKGKRLTVQSVSRTIKNRLKQAGFDSDRLTAHSLRHTAVTLSLLANKDIREVQKFARHRNIATTLIYDHSIKLENNTCSQAVSDAIF